MSEIYTNMVDWPDLRERIRPLLFPENNRIIDRYRGGEIKGEIIEDLDLDLIWPDKRLRKNWISFISENPDFSDCLRVASRSLQGKRNESWLKKYHNLYYSLKEKGYSEDYFPVVGVHIGGNTYYRLDGTHRCSSLLQLGYEKIRVLKIELEEIMLHYPDIMGEYEGYILENFPDYQRFDGGMTPSTHERYENLLTISQDYVSGKTVADIGCNAGYFSILLSKTDSAMVHGMDISEIDIEAARIFSRRNNISEERLKFHLSPADEEMEILRQCDVIFFIRSIYHLGKGAATILEGVRPGTVIIVECNRGQITKIRDPEKIVPTVGKRLALVENLIPFVKNKGFSIVSKTKNIDDLIIAVKEG